MAYCEKGAAEMGKILHVDDSPVNTSNPPEAVGISELPNEILIEIFSYLPLGDLAWSSHTCRRWHNILKEKKSLWKNKKCTTSHMENIREVLAVAGAMPQLEALYLIYSRDFRIDIAWPEATVHHHYGDAPLTWEPYFKAFDTECLVLDHSMQKNVFFYLSWVDCQKLRRIVVLEHPHIHTHHSRPGSLITHVNSLPSSSWNGTTAPHALIQSPSSQPESHPSTSGSSRGQCQYDKCPRMVTCDNRLPNDNYEEENRVCPSLEEVNVYCKYIWDQHLENLCSLGPLRALHIECQRLHSLTFVRCCCSSLEVLIITDCRCLLEDAFAELCCLENLRVLHLSNCRIAESTVRSYIDKLPHLESVFFNGHEVR